VFDQSLVDRIRPVVQRLSNCFAGDELIERSVTANAKQSAADLLANSELLRRAAADSGLKVVSAVYDLRSGTVRELR
jgi:carbonic anhydrase